MNKNEIGYVVEVKDDMAKVRIGRHGDCKNCGACPGSNNLIIDVNNLVGANIGQKVCIEFKEVKLIQSVYIVYVQPLLAIFFGIIIGYLIAKYTHQWINLYEIIFGSIFLIISIIYIKITDKKIERNINNIPSIIKILS